MSLVTVFLLNESAEAHEQLISSETVGGKNDFSEWSNSGCKNGFFHFGIDDNYFHLDDVRLNELYDIRKS